MRELLLCPVDGERLLISRRLLGPLRCDAWTGDDGHTQSVGQNRLQPYALHSVGVEQDGYDPS